MDDFKTRMKSLRARAGYKSQADAASVIGCERGTVSMWEAPSSSVGAVSEEYIFGVSRAYKVRPEWINDLSSSDDGYPYVGESRASYSVQPRESGTDPVDRGPTTESGRLFERLGDLLAKADAPTRQAVGQLLSLYAQKPEDGDRLIRAIRALLEPDANT